MKTLLTLILLLFLFAPEIKAQEQNTSPVIAYVAPKYKVGQNALFDFKNATFRGKIVDITYRNKKRQIFYLIKVEYCWYFDNPVDFVGFKIWLPEGSIWIGRND